MASDSEVAALGEPRPLELGDLPHATLVIARAFAWHEAWGEWTIPDPEGREERMHRMIDADVRERFLPHGECSTIGGACTTLWIPPASAPGAEVFASRRSESEYSAYKERADAIRRADAIITSMKPAEEHWYLDTIATDPDLFGRGLASRLLASDLARRDAGGDLCVLDTHTPRQVAFYERHGFESVGRDDLGEGLTVHVMVRRPRAV